MARDKIGASFAWVACEPQPAFARTEHEEFVFALGRLLAAGTGNVLLGLKVCEQVQQGVLVIAAGTFHVETVV